MQCTSSMKQVGLALHNHCNTHNVFPGSSHQIAIRGARPHANGPSNSSPNNGFADGNMRRYSGLVMLLPFIEQSALYEMEATRVRPNGDRAGWEGNPWDADWYGERNAWSTVVNVFLCPSDGNGSNPANRTTGTNYRVCRGDGNINWDRWQECRGLFGPQIFFERDFSAIQDGASNTIALAEAVVGSEDKMNLVKGGICMTAYEIEGRKENPNAAEIFACINSSSSQELAPGKISNRTDGFSGSRWGDGQNQFTLFFTYMPPNGVSVVHTGEGEHWLMIAASSFHTGGVNVCLADGSVRFVSDTVDTGGLRLRSGKEIGPGVGSRWSRGPSPFGVWGGMGTIGEGEAVSL